MFVDHYKVLGIDKSADGEKIKKAYRTLALKFHPDVCKLPDAQSRFIEVQEAYEILGDITRRHYYNILWENHYQPKEKTRSQQAYEQKVENDYQQWRRQANKTAVELAKEKFDKARDAVYEGVGQVVGGTVNFLSYIYGAIFLVGPFVGVYTSYSSIDVWDTDKNGNAIAGFVICSILSILILAVTIIIIRNKLRE